MACHLGPAQCRAQHIAPKLKGATPDDGDWEAKCPVCRHGGFRVSTADKRYYRNVWTCNCKLCKCEGSGQLRPGLLALGIMPGCLGSYEGKHQAGVDPVMAQRVQLAARDILAAPGLKPADMRIVLAEALGEKVPTEFRAFVRWAMSVGIGRTQAYEAAGRWCRPPDESSSPEGGVDDNQS